MTNENDKGAQVGARIKSLDDAKNVVLSADYSRGYGKGYHAGWREAGQWTSGEILDLAHAEVLDRETEEFHRGYSAAFLVGFNDCKAGNDYTGPFVSNGEQFEARPHGQPDEREDEPGEPISGGEDMSWLREDWTREQSVNALNSAICGHALNATTVAICLTSALIRGGPSVLAVFGLLCALLAWGGAHLVSGEDRRSTLYTGGYLFCFIFTVVGIVAGLLSLARF